MLNCPVNAFTWILFGQFSFVFINTSASSFNNINRLPVALLFQIFLFAVFDPCVGGRRFASCVTLHRKWLIFHTFQIKREWLNFRQYLNLQPNVSFHQFARLVNGSSTSATKIEISTSLRWHKSTYTIQRSLTIFHRQIRQHF